MCAPPVRRLFALALLCAPLASGCACARQDAVRERVRERDRREWEQQAAVAAEPVPDPSYATPKELQEQRARNEADFRSGSRR